MFCNSINNLILILSRDQLMETGLNGENGNLVRHHVAKEPKQEADTVIIQFMNMVEIIVVMMGHWRMKPKCVTKKLAVSTWIIHICHE